MSAAALPVTQQSVKRVLADTAATEGQKRGEVAQAGRIVSLVESIQAQRKSVPAQHKVVAAQHKVGAEQHHLGSLKGYSVPL